MPPPSSQAIAVVTLTLIALVLLTGYVGAYYALCTVDGDLRIFSQEWQRIAFTPAARIEGVLTHRPVRAVRYVPLWVTSPA